jgi:hypothetical protein
MDSPLQPREIGRRATFCEATRDALESELGSMALLVPFDLATVWLACGDVLVARAQCPTPLTSAATSLPMSQWPKAREVFETGRYRRA